MTVELNWKRISEVIESEEMIGFCLACGFEQHGVEPDAEGYACESCGAHEVWGAEQILIAK